MESFTEFIAGLTPKFTAVIDTDLGQEDYIAIDLSEENLALEEIDIASSAEFSRFIADFLKESGKKVAFGGYNEMRLLYRRSALFNTGGEEDARRNIHMGVDFWADAHTPVLAVLDGKVHSFRDNANFGDYGPTIILEHSCNNRVFYSLYGHLSRSSIENLKPEQKISGGQTIGELGTSRENGDYAPHLHFQIIENLNEKFGDFPGVTTRNELDFYLRNCPDPNLLLKITS